MILLDPEHKGIPVIQGRLVVDQNAGGRGSAVVLRHRHDQLAADVAVVGVDVPRLVKLVGLQPLPGALHCVERRAHVSVVELIFL